MRRLLLGAALVITSCGSAAGTPASTPAPRDRDDTGDSSISIRRPVVQGTELLCAFSYVEWSGSGALSCDWQGWHDARRPQ